MWLGLLYHTIVVRGWNPAYGFSPFFLSNPVQIHFIILIFSAIAPIHHWKCKKKTNERVQITLLDENAGGVKLARRRRRKNWAPAAVYCNRFLHSSTRSFFVSFFLFSHRNTVFFLVSCDHSKKSEGLEVGKK